MQRIDATLTQEEIDNITYYLNYLRQWNNTETVSYTHLRAHETVLDLVCRLLLEKKKQTNTTHVCVNEPAHTHQRAHMRQHQSRDVNYRL